MQIGGPILVDNDSSKYDETIKQVWLLKLSVKF